MFAGCGGTTTTTISGNRTTTTATATATATASGGESGRSSPPSVIASAVAMDIDGLHVQSNFGLSCPSSRYMGGLLIVPSNRLTYDTAEASQMVQYVRAIADRQASPPPYYAGIVQLPVPTTLRWVSAGRNDTQLTPTVAVADCFFEMQITNTSSQRVQLLRTGVRLTASTQVNNYQYHLIDFCSVLSPSDIYWDDCIPHPEGGSACSFVSADVTLGVGTAGVSFDGPITQTIDPNNPCPPGLVIDPGKTGEIYIHFASPKNLIYSVVPTLTVDTSGSPTVLSLDAMGNTLSFASGSQFTCYAFHGNTLVEESINGANRNVMCA